MPHVLCIGCYCCCYCWYWLGGEWRKHVLVLRSPKEKAGSVYLAFPVLFCHRALLTTKIPTCILETMALWDTLEILVQVVSIALYRFRIQQATLSAFKLSPWNVIDVRVGRGCSRLPAHPV